MKKGIKFQYLNRISPIYCYFDETILVNDCFAELDLGWGIKCSLRPNLSCGIFVYIRSVIFFAGLTLLCREISILQREL